MKGAKTPGSGRKAGTPNKATAELRALAQQYGPQAIQELAVLAGVLIKAGRKAAESEQARIAAAKELLDRAYGKSTQPLSGDPNMPPVLPDHIRITIVKPEERV